MIDYHLLGLVTAAQDGWAADLAPQQQLLLAVLVMERGKPVPRQSLIRVLWDEDERIPDAPERALARAAAEVRAKLREAPGGRRADDPLPASGDTYRLLMEPSQADALRFRAKLDEARKASGRSVIALLRAALREWGAEAAGLFGGQPLSGLRGRWAEGIRTELRKDYRDARYACLRQDLDDHQYDRLAAECRSLATEPDVWHDEKFLALWMIAAYRSGRRTDVQRIYQTATDSVQAELGMSPSGFLTRLAEVIKSEDPRLDGPGDRFELDLIRPAAVLTATEAPDTMTVPGRATGSPAEHTRWAAQTERYTNRQRTRMSDSKPVINFNNHDNTRVGIQAGEVNVPLTIRMESGPDGEMTMSETADFPQTASPFGEADAARD